MVAVDGQSAGQHGHIGLEGGRLIGGNAVPHLEIHVADTLLGVLLAVQNVPGNGHAVSAVLGRRLGNGLLVAVEEQADDVAVGHGLSFLGASPEMGL